MSASWEPVICHFHVTLTMLGQLREEGAGSPKDKWNYGKFIKKNKKSVGELEATISKIFGVNFTFLLGACDVGDNIHSTEFQQIGAIVRGISASTVDLEENFNDDGSVIEPDAYLNTIRSIMADLENQMAEVRSFFARYL